MISPRNHLLRFRMIPVPAVEPIEIPAAAPLAVVAAPLSIAQAQDDDIDAVDQLDEDLFPIFEEEAIELLPQLGSALSSMGNAAGQFECT